LQLQHFGAECNLPTQNSEEPVFLILFMVNKYRRNRISIRYNKKLPFSKWKYFRGYFRQRPGHSNFVLSSWLCCSWIRLNIPLQQKTILKKKKI